MLCWAENVGVDQSSAIGDLRIAPANEASWRDIEAIFGTADYPFHCRCQR
jgi:hypothetical protein